MVIKRRGAGNCASACYKPNPNQPCSNRLVGLVREAGYVVDFVRLVERPCVLWDSD